jgi:hypothetical protein
MSIAEDDIPGAPKYGRQERANVALNDRWRVTVVRLRSPWVLEQLSDDGEWIDRFHVRTRDMLVGLVKAKCGPIDAEAQAILNGLPRRVDHHDDGPRSPPRRKSAPPHRLASPPPSVSPPTVDMPVVIAVLGPKWRVISDRKQWILQSRHDGGWLSRQHCTLRGTLLVRIQALVVGADPAALAILRKLPKRIADADDQRHADDAEDDGDHRHADDQREDTMSESS